MVDRMRILEGGDHAVNRTVDEMRRIRRIDGTRADELHDAEKAQNIVTVKSRCTQETACRQDGQQAANECRYDGKAD